MRKLDQITCPICNEKFMESESLLEAFREDTKTKYLSNLVRHYRHSHIRYWNKCWGPYGNKCRGNCVSTPKMQTVQSREIPSSLNYQKKSRFTEVQVGQSLQSMNPV